MLGFPIGNLGGRKVSRGNNLVQGTLDLLILKTLSLQPLHGWGVGQRLEQVTGGELRVPQGSLYPALHRLEQQGWVAARWGASENGRRAKYYAVTAAGRKRLRREVAEWDRLANAIGVVVREVR